MSPVRKTVNGSLEWEVLKALAREAGRPYKEHEAGRVPILPGQLELFPLAPPKFHARKARSFSAANINRKRRTT